ncbi:unnamed protein product, partial [Didymodactylos carnosus]
MGCGPFHKSPTKCLSNVDVRDLQQFWQLIPVSEYPEYGTHLML